MVLAFNEYQGNSSNITCECLRTSIVSSEYNVKVNTVKGCSPGDVQINSIIENLGSSGVWTREQSVGILWWRR